MGTETIYPLATTDGESIPLDVISPIELWKFILTASTASDVETLTTLNCLLGVKASVDSILRFGATVVAVPVSGDKLADCVFIPAGTILIVQPTSLSFSVMPLADGIIWVQVMQKWAALSQTLLFERR
jgi:hypothetical protein